MPRNNIDIFQFYSDADAERMQSAFIRLFANREQNNTPRSLPPTKKELNQATNGDTRVVGLVRDYLKMASLIQIAGYDGAELPVFSAGLFIDQGQ